MTTAPPVLAVVGPTGSGKSELAMRVADLVPRIEIVAVDAFTLYRGLDIATAKPTARERARVPHHVVDVLDPDVDADVAWFQATARAAVADVHRRGGVPVLVGGSGLYFRAVVDDLRFPPTDRRVRVELEQRWAADPRAAHARLADVDPEAAAKIQPDNLRRTVRALEVIALTGEPFSTYAWAWERHESVYPGLDVAYLEPEPAVLRRRIHDRAVRMVAAGLVDEAAGLRDRHPEVLSSTARHAIGYAEAFAVLDGELGRGELADRIAARTWRYARRQRSWFRRDPRCEPADVSAVLDRWHPSGL